jgi:hypothetical protein
LQCGYETNWKTLIFLGFYNINSKNLSKIKELCQSFDNKKLAPPKRKKQTLTPNPILIMNKPLVT